MRVSKLKITLIAGKIRLDILLTETPLQRTSVATSFCAHAAVVRSEHHCKFLCAQLTSVTVVVPLLALYIKLKWQLIKRFCLSNIF